MEEAADNIVPANCSPIEVDRLLNFLPEPLRSKILLKLPTKDVVELSEVCRRWRDLWKSVPGLDLGYADFPTYNSYVIFVDEFLALNVGLEKFKLKSKSSSLRYEWNQDEPLVAHVTRWMNTVLEKKLEHLHILERQWHLNNPVEVPRTVYTCTSLVSLKLRDAKLADTDSVFLPSLKVIKLDGVKFHSDSALEWLVSGSPVLETLTVKRSAGDNLKVLCVRSKSLLSFAFVGLRDKQIDEVLEAKIHAPRLEFLNLMNDQTDHFVIDDLGSLVKVNMDTTFNLDCSHIDVDDFVKRFAIRDFLIGIYSAKQLAVTSYPLEVFYVYSLLPLENVSLLHVDFIYNNWEMLHVLLEGCPRVKTLTLAFRKAPVRGFTILPREHRVLPTLQTVEIVQPMVDHDAGEMKLVTYLLQNSANLKELIFGLGDFRKKEGAIILKKLKRLREMAISSCCLEFSVL